jgi:hypothetical protein
MTGKDRRRRGRPAVEAGSPSVSLHVRLSGAQYDAAYSGARAARMPLSAWVRRALRAAVVVPQKG